MIDDVLQTPQQVVPADSGRQSYQSQVDFGGGKVFLLRVMVAAGEDPAVVVPVYRASKIAKSWSAS
jgi:hypothetical protein